MNVRIVSLFVVCVSGCATPSEMTRQAVNTAALVGELRRSTDDFERQQRLLAQITTESIVRVETDIAQIGLLGDTDATLKNSDGDNMAPRLEGALHAASSIAARRWTTNPALDARIAAIRAASKSTPASGEALSAVQRAALLMAQELSLEERLSEQAKFIKTVRDGVRVNRDAMLEAEQAANVNAANVSAATVP
jgi:hypothetical protein